MQLAPDLRGNGGRHEAATVIGDEHGVGAQRRRHRGTEERLAALFVQCSVREPIDAHDLLLR